MWCFLSKTKKVVPIKNKNNQTYMVFLNKTISTVSSQVQLNAPGGSNSSGSSSNQFIYLLLGILGGCLVTFVISVIILHKYRQKKKKNEKSKPYVIENYFNPFRENETEMKTFKKKSSRPFNPNRLSHDCKQFVVKGDTNGLSEHIMNEHSNLFEV
jgi:mannitol-specific phosphotransferase system IIBC component